MAKLEHLQSMRGKRVLITGANGHLGRLIAEVMAALGADLILLDRPCSQLAEQKEWIQKNWDVRVLSIECDLELEQERQIAIDRIKQDGAGINCLVNNAAFVGSSDLKGWSTNFEEQSLHTWRRALEVNLTSPFHLSQAFAKELRKGAVGSIINIGSIYGELGPDWRMYEGTEMANPAAYAASKGGLIQLTRWLATTLAPQIRVNCISPGGIYRNQPEQFVRRYVNKTPLQRMAKEDDFIGAVAFLASNMSSYVTGQVLRVDGGWCEW
jgi:NAD(P)-dependent dehydrogenase (short-subunit alcohol dehydrogenase family)